MVEKGVKGKTTDLIIIRFSGQNQKPQGQLRQQIAKAQPRGKNQVLPLILPMFIPEPKRPMFSMPPPKGPSMPGRETCTRNCESSRFCREERWFHVSPWIDWLGAEGILVPGL